MNLPNTLSLVRIFLVPFLVVFLIANAEPRNYPAAAIFIAAVLTDWLDGRIARSRGQVTTLGQLLDPIADKLLIAAALISLVEIQRVPAWVATVIVGRDIAITGLRGIAASQGLIIAASQLGKYKMVAEVIAVILLMLDPGTSRLPGLPLSLGGLAVGVAVVLSVVSGIDYFARFRRQLGFGITVGSGRE
ncbi:MAG TPA: CDP-diacylglycerol--glycerol-3-phosphate 3-phosphatidyltransferase [Candidatus Methylomirabilis sp.]|nr:CDP-diacylglycerol--glycerol-3-phosphate 3-phosphatidyltransferase [Candidatus Methylomirabilis sp.]